jgi:hypothetical protein
MAMAHCATDNGASRGTRDSSDSANISSVASDRLATTAWIWPLDRVPSDQAARVAGRLRRRRARATMRAASAEEMRQKLRSQAMVEAAPSRAQLPATSKASTASHTLASKRSPRANDSMSPSAQGVASTSSTASANPSNTLPIVHPYGHKAKA